MLHQTRRAATSMAGLAIYDTIAVRCNCGTSPQNGVTGQAASMGQSCRLATGHQGASATPLRKRASWIHQPGSLGFQAGRAGPHPIEDPRPRGGDLCAPGDTINRAVRENTGQPDFRRTNPTGRDTEARQLHDLRKGESHTVDRRRVFTDAVKRKRKNQKRRSERRSPEYAGAGYLKGGSFSSPLVASVVLSHPLQHLQPLVD